MVSSINRLNSELREKLEVSRKDLNEEKSKSFKLREEIDSISMKHKRESERYKTQIEEIEKDWNSKVEAFSCLISMYNELRVKAKSLEEELEKIESLEGKPI